MTTLRERHHQTQVADIIATVSDTETVTEMQAASKQYARIRQALRLAITEITSIDDEYGTEHMDLVHDLGQIIGGLRNEELDLHEMTAYTFGDDTETAISKEQAVTEIGAALMRIEGITESIKHQNAGA